MLDAAFVRQNLDEVAQRLATRGGVPADLEMFREAEAARRTLTPRLDTKRQEQKTLSRKVGRLIAATQDHGAEAEELKQQSRSLAAEIAALEEQLRQAEATRDQALLRIPNLPHGSVPRGTTPSDNREVRRHGEPPAFAFEPKAHWDLGPALGILDFERATKMSGARFSVLMGAGARLARALIDFMLDLHTSEHEYTEVEPPFLVNAATLTGTGNLPKFEGDLFKIAGDWDLYLIPTAEVPLTNLHRGEILDGRELPIRYAAYTPCFRSEAGSYGADVRGLIRQHQFDKVELVKFARPDQSYDELESLTANAEEVLKRLGLAYRTVLLCTGDMGFASAKTYDIEVWLPGQNAYREISSCSNTEAFQARRAGIKFRPDGQGKPEFVHTLNGSGLAVGRTLIAILENYQQKDGSVIVPEALRPYMRGLEAIEKR
ncbi:MAG: serine--tRNA ligase [Acidobacteria bacterium]|nr:serine--tRNA ligase [Acidobacteriota bacterium]